MDDSDSDSDGSPLPYLLNASSSFSGNRADTPRPSTSFMFPQSPSATATETFSLGSQYSSSWDDETRSSIVQLNDSRSTSMAKNNVRKAEPCETEPPAKIPRMSSRANDQDGEICPICLEPCENTGAHRLVSLKCGHLFGHTCVERWLKCKGLKYKSCPTCKCRSTVNDIRCIYAINVTTADTSELSELKRQIEAYQTERMRTEMELQRAKIAHRACLLELEKLRNQSTRSDGDQTKSEWTFVLDRDIKMLDAGCAVLTYNCKTSDLIVSQKSTNTLLPGYGIREINCVDYNVGSYLHLHTRPIRDMCYCEPLDLLLSVSADGTARVVERGVTNLNIKFDSPPWSCAWDATHNNQFYIGGVGGNVCQYDIRNTNSPMNKLTCTVDVTPVVSLCSTRYGLLTCHLDSSWLWTSTANNVKPRSLSVAGPFTSVSFDPDTRRALIACRRSRLKVFRLEYDNDEVLCEMEHTFKGRSRSLIKSRACFVKAGQSSWIAAHADVKGDSILQLYGLDGEQNVTVAVSEPAVGMCSARVNAATILFSLYESSLKTYKAVPATS